MRVYIGPYKDRWMSNVHTYYMDWKYKGLWPRYAEDTVEPLDERLVDTLEDTLQWIYNHTINLYWDSRSRKIQVKIDNFDTWSMDHSLAFIIVPMLKQLKETKHGAPFVDDEDVPEHLRSTNAPPKENEYDLDEYHFKRWDWVLDEMIWAFEQKNRDHWESDYYEYKDVEPNKEARSVFESIGLELVWEDREGRKAHQDRMTNGFKLFGKYYEALWD